jgi:hypothetical protein
MSESVDKGFFHRPKPNGTFDSICLCCYLTIANSATESLLGPAEGTHKCIERISRRAKVIVMGRRQLQDRSD